METSQGDTWGDVDRHVNHNGGPNPVADGHTHPVAHGGPRPIAHGHTNGDQYAFRHFQIREGV